MIDVFVYCVFVVAIIHENVGKHVMVILLLSWLGSSILVYLIARFVCASNRARLSAHTPLALLLFFEKRNDR